MPQYTPSQHNNKNIFLKAPMRLLAETTWSSMIYSKYQKGNKIKNICHAELFFKNEGEILSTIEPPHSILSLKQQAQRTEKEY
jgi:hypothetical protein